MTLSRALADAPGRPRLWQYLDPLRQGNRAATLRFRGRIEVPCWRGTAEKHVAKFGGPVQSKPPADLQVQLSSRADTLSRQQDSLAACSASPQLIGKPHD